MHKRYINRLIAVYTKHKRHKMNATEIDFSSIHVGSDILKGVEAFRSSDEEEQSPKPAKRKSTDEVSADVPAKKVTRDKALDITMDSLVEHVTAKKKPFEATPLSVQRDWAACATYQIQS